MKILHDLEPKTKHIRLEAWEAEEYLILHTPKGTIDIDIKNGHLDLNDKASDSYSITRYVGDRRTPSTIQRLGTKSEKK